MTATRLPSGGRIDRKTVLRLSFDGCALDAHPGDTLATALLANDQLLVARSFKYHRPRGIFSAGVEEPNALVQLRTGDRSEPNVPATVIEAFDGLEACPQNSWPNLHFDIGVINQAIAQFLSAGFYYKTFMGPFDGTGFWMFCERFIRKAAGMGRATMISDPDEYEKVNAFCDVLIVGAGPAGLAAALAAGRAGARVILAEQDNNLGGSLLNAPLGADTDDWVTTVLDELRALPNVQILTRTTVFGAYDDDVYGLLERVSDHVPMPLPGQPRQRFWLVRTRQAVLATGAIERPMIFANNDRPGVMLASAARAYLNRFAIRAGERVIVATNNDSAYLTARDLARSGAKVTVADLRQEIGSGALAVSQYSNVEVLRGVGVLAACGRARVSGAILVPVDAYGKASGKTWRIACDLIAVSGGWSPCIHLWSQRNRKAKFLEAEECFVPSGDGVPTMWYAGSIAAETDDERIVISGFNTGASAAKEANFHGYPGIAPLPPKDGEGFTWIRGLHRVHTVSAADGKSAGKAFVDFQHDVTLDDIDLAHREGYVSVEHLKRYTTAGMANDQGKLSNVNSLIRMATLRGITIPEAGTTTYRPPYTPITIGALVGRDHGLHFRPTRLSPIHDWHDQDGAVMTDAGAWKRPWYYPRNGEDIRKAYIREASSVRAAVGMVDVSTLGKIALQGPDAAELLNRVYVNKWKALAIGRVRYGVMLREDGIVLDDGTTARIGEQDYFMTTTTANAAKVLMFLEFLLQTSWRELRVHVTSVTDQWAAIAIAGPQSRTLLSSVAIGVDMGREAFPANHLRYAEIAGAPVRIHRVSYSGELAYEIYVPSGFAHMVWTTIAEIGKPLGLLTYGTEAMGALRIEKGHVAGAEIDGRTTLHDLELHGLAAKDKPFVGSVLMSREFLVAPTRPTLVGLHIAGKKGARAGSLLFSSEGPVSGHGEGWVSSTTYSPALGGNIALGFLRNGGARMGEALRIVDHLGGDTLTAQVVSSHFYDPEGDRQNA